MRNQRTHALGVPLRQHKFRSQVRIGAITHAYNYSVYTRAYTLCEISYTHQKHLVGNVTMLATRTSRDIDCMVCLVLKGRE